MKMRNLVVAITFVSTLMILRSAVSEEPGGGARAAAINYYQVKDILVGFALSDPANSELKRKYEESKTQEKAQSAAYLKKMGEAASTGQITIPMGDTDAIMKNMQAQRAVDDLAKKEFSRFVEQLYGKQYDVIINGGGEQVLYSKVPLPDLTSEFRQYLLNHRAP